MTAAFSCKARLYSLSLFALAVCNPAWVLAAPATNPGQVKIGQDGWLIFQDNMPDYRKANAFKPAELDSILVRTKKLHDKLAESRSSLVWAMAPNTTTVYPESVPSRFKETNPKSRREQLRELLAGSASLNFLDLTDALLEEKARRQIYAKTDTHWNDIGAFVGYRQIMLALARLRPEQASRLSPLLIERFNITSKAAAGGDLARMLGLQDELTEERILLVPKQPRAATTEAFDVVDPDAPAKTLTKWQTLVSRNKASCPGPKAVIYRDSFGNALLPFLQEHFCKATIVWYQAANLDLSLIEREKPDFVIVINTERMTESVIKSLLQPVAW